MKNISIFSPYTDNLQTMIDKANDRFAPLWYPKYFNFGTPQYGLTFSSVIGRSRIEAAASIVDRDSSTPLRGRGSLEKYQGDIPAIREMVKMTESDYRDFMVLKNMNIGGNVDVNAILDMLFNDVKRVGDSAHKRLDIMVLEAVSTGKISLDINNNPDGVILENQLDLLMPTTNKKQATTTWATSATATPLADIQTVIDAGSDRGVSFSKILMSKALFAKFRKCKEVIDTMMAYYYGPKVGSGFNPVAVSTLDKINEFMDAEKLPTIELVDERIGIEKDGIIGVIKPFNENNVSFIPDGKLGVIKHAFAIEELQPVGKVSYSKYNKALISKWSENEPFGEWTKVELNAFPAFEAIDSTFILEAVF